MRVIGFNFTKVSAERLKTDVKDLKINTTIDIPEITTLDSDIIKTKDDILEVKFTYKVNYEPGFAKVDMAGTILLSVEPKLAKEIVAQWKKKTTPTELNMFIYNIIIRKAGPKALVLEDELNIPAHLPLPMMRKSDKEK